MEITLRQLMGLNVYSLERGERIGKVRSFVLDTKAKELVALLVADSSLRRDERVLCLGDVKGLSLEAVTVDSPAALRKKADCPHLKDLLKAATEVEGLSVLQKDGTFLGRASAVILDSETGQICRLELSSGSFLANAARCRRSLGAADIEVIGSDVILAKDDANLKEETPRHPLGVRNRPKPRPEAKAEPGCGDRIRAMSGKYPLPRKRKTVFPEVPVENHEEES